MKAKVPSKRKRNIYCRQVLNASEYVTLTFYVSVGYELLGISWFNSSAGVIRIVKETWIRWK
jgi:hypothetical protein